MSNPIFADLVDILLLPSLVPAMLYLSNQLWARQASQGAIIRILQLILLQPSSVSHEASTMLSSVLNIVAKPLEHSLRSYQRQDPKSPDVEPLLRALKENLPLSRRTGGADHNELESWTGANGGNTTNPSSTHPTNPNGPANPPGGSPNTHGGGLAGSVRSTIANLTQWAQHPALGLPAPYTHRQILAALKMLGAKHLLTILLEELKAQSELGNDSLAYDVITSVICAPDSNTFSLTSPSSASTTAPEDTAAQQQQSNQQRRMTLREALKYEAEDWNRIQKASPDPLAAETVVRLYRRVEAQMTPLPPPVQVVAGVDQSAMGGVDAMLNSAAAEMVGDALGVSVGGDGALDDALAAVGVGVDASSVVGVGGGLHEGMTLDTAGLAGSGLNTGAGGDLNNLDSATGSVGGGAGGGSSSMDDIFGIQLSGGSGDFSRDMDFNWDTMDLS